MAKKIKKVDVKMEAKLEVSAAITEALKTAGFEVLDGTEFGFTKGSLVARHTATDVQIKLVAPKAGIERYEVLTDEDEAEEGTEG